MSEKPSKAVPGTSWNDPKVPGLRLRHLKTKSVYYLFYRTRAGVQRNMKIGDERVFTLTAAREAAKRILALVASGEDPAAEEEAEDLKTMADLRDWHLERHSETKNKSSWKEDVEALYKNHVLPHFGEGKPVRDVTTAEVTDLHHKMRKTPAAANRMASMLHKAFALAEKWGWRDPNTNPVNVDRYKEVKRRRLPQADEAARLLIALNKMRESNPWFVGLVELLCFTGARLNEIATAKWEWVRPNGLHLPDSKTGEKVIPLSALARETLKDIPRVKGNPYIIVGRHKKGHLVTVTKPWAALLKEAGVTNLRRHDLRRFFASAGLSSGVSLSQVGELLGHMEPSTTKRYAYLLAGEAQTAADIAAEAVKEIMTGSGKVVAIGDFRR